jgi:two-component system, cell cycle response regulator
MSHELVAENRRLQKQLAQLLEQAEHNQQILQRQQAFDLQFISAASFRELLEALFQSFASAAALDTVSLSLLDPEYELRRMLAGLGISLSSWPQLIFLQEEAEFGELAGQLSRPLLAAYSEQLHGAMFPEPLPPPACVAIVPLMRRGQLIGSLNLGSADQRRFLPGMGTDFIEHRASIIAICLENVINAERLKHIGLTDPLTGVNNRRYLERRLLEELGRSRRQGYPLSCMYIDIDHFKKINDSRGHQAGDEVLREVAGRIKAELRLNDAMGRFGGEEFVALLIDADMADAMCVAERIRQSVGEMPLRLANGDSLAVSVSIGVAALGGVQPDAAVETLAQAFLARADRALYQAKADGRNRVVSAS